MDRLAEFFAMGGYASFVWPAYIIALVIMVGLLGVSIRDLRRNESLLETLRARRREHSFEEFD